MTTFLTTPAKDKFRIWVINSDVMASQQPEKNIAKGSHLQCMKRNNTRFY